MKKMELLYFENVFSCEKHKSLECSWNSKPLLLTPQVTKNIKRKENSNSNICLFMFPVSFDHQKPLHLVGCVLLFHLNDLLFLVDIFFKSVIFFLIVFFYITIFSFTIITKIEVRRRHFLLSEVLQQLHHLDRKHHRCQRIYHLQ